MSNYKQTQFEYRIKLRQLKSRLPSFTYEFLDEKADRNPHTAVAYASDLIIFFEYLREYCPKEISLELFNDFTFQDINEYQDYLNINHPEINGYCNEKAGIKRRISALRGLFKYLFSHEYITSNPMDGIKPIGIPEEHVITRLTSDEVTELMKLVYDTNLKSDRQKKIAQNTKYRDIAIFTLLLYTGIRVSECSNIDISDIDFKNNSIKIIRKRGKEQLIYFDDYVREALNDYINFERDNTLNDPALFYSLKKKRISIRAIQDLVKKYTIELGLNKTISPHKLRSTYGTALYNATGDIRLVADVLGHSDINTTAKHYAATDDEHRRKAAQINPYQG